MADVQLDREVELGNGANRFDVWRQSQTLGPQPPTADSGPPETNGGSEGAPEASE